MMHSHCVLRKVNVKDFIVHVELLQQHLYNCRFRLRLPTGKARLEPRPGHLLIWEDKQALIKFKVVLCESIIQIVPSEKLSWNAF